MKQQDLTSALFHLVDLNETKEQMLLAGGINAATYLSLKQILLEFVKENSDLYTSARQAILENAKTTQEEIAAFEEIKDEEAREEAINKYVKENKSIKRQKKMIKEFAEYELTPSVQGAFYGVAKIIEEHIKATNNIHILYERFVEVVNYCNEQAKPASEK